MTQDSKKHDGLTLLAGRLGKLVAAAGMAASLSACASAGIGNWSEPSQAEMAQTAQSEEARAAAAADSFASNSPTWGQYSGRPGQTEPATPEDGRYREKQGLGGPTPN